MENTPAEASAKYLHSIISERRVLSVSLTLSLESEKGMEYDISNKRSAKQMTRCSSARWTDKTGNGNLQAGSSPSPHFLTVNPSQLVSSLAKGWLD